MDYVTKICMHFVRRYSFCRNNSNGKQTLSKLICFAGIIFTSCIHADTLKFELHGLNGDVLKNVQTRLEVLKELQGKKLTPEKVQTFYQQSNEEIKKGLQPYGYFHPKVTSRLSHHEDQWTANYKIATGHAIIISKLDIKIYGPGQDNATIKKFLVNFPLHEGEVFNTTEYEQAKEKLFNVANEEGYIKASFKDNEVAIHERTNHVTIVMHLESGPRYYFGSINFESNTYTKPFLKRFVNFNKDQAFSSQKLIAFQQDLASSYYFQQVVVTPDFEHAENYQIPVNIMVVPPKSQKYRFGVGYGTFTGPRFTAGVSLRRLTDTGQYFEAQMRLSEVLSGIAAKYYIPGKNPLTDKWILGANYQKFSPEEGWSNSKTLSIGYDKKTPRWQSNTSLNYLKERFRVNNMPSQNSELLYPAWNISYLKVDDLINPDFGKSFNLILRGASNSLLSSTSFLQAELKGKVIFSPTDQSRVIARGDFGYTIVHDISELPLTMRFFAGGLSSVRGYKDSSIGPGKYLEVGSFEYQHLLVGNWTGAIFYDIGAASNHFNQGYKAGKGVGIVYNSAIGPVKFYLAKGKKYGFEFSVGPEF